MKLTRKILLGIVVITMVVSCFTLFSSAEFTEDNIEDILQYQLYEQYLSEDFEAFNDGSAFNITDSATAHNVSGFTGTRYKRSCKIATDTDENKYYKIGGADIVPDFRIDLSDMYASNCFVTSFRYRTTAAAGKDGASLKINVNVNHPGDTVVPLKSFTMLKADAATGKKVFEYFYYDEASGAPALKAVEGIALDYDKWYSIELVCNFETHTATLEITPDGEDTVKTSFSLYVYDKIVDAAINGEGVNASSYLHLDDIYFYEGSFVRHKDDREIKTAEAMLNLEALSKTNISMSSKIRIADVFNTLLNESSYETTETTPNREQVDAAVAYGRVYIYDTYVAAYEKYTNEIDSTKNYYERMEYVDFVSKFEKFLPSDEAELGALAGVTEGEIASVLASDAKYKAEVDDLVRVRTDSEQFLSGMELYDPTDRSYPYIRAAYTLVCDYVKRDAAYKNAAEGCKYATVADAEAVFATLSAKKTLIEKTAYDFHVAVLNMDAAESEVAFGKYYANCCTATELYNDGVLHPGLDNATVTVADLAALPGADFTSDYETLLEVIEVYKNHKKYVDGRVAESEKFMEFVSRAKNSTYYVTIELNLDYAYFYIDEDTAELSVEDEYAGVLEARALYANLRKFLADSSAAAEKYLAEVDKIASATTFAAKKAAVEAALNYKKTGNITGLAGVPEANSKLAIAEAEIKSLEGYSSTLIATVEKLKTATDMSERRELIKIALNCRDKSEDTISGVSEAKAELKTIVEKYDADIKAINDAFLGAVKTASTVSSAVVADEDVYKTDEIIGKLVK